MDEIQRAEMAMDRGAYQQALRILNNIEGEDEAYLGWQIATCYLASGQQNLAFVACEKIVDQAAISSDLGQKILGIMIQCCTLNGDFGRARYLSEAARKALETDPGDCCLETLLGMAKQRAELSRDLGQPDDAEEMFGDVIAVLDDALEHHDDPELQLGKAKLLEWRAHNRWLGHATVLAEFDLEDASALYQKHLGVGSKAALFTENLLTELRACA